MAIQMRRGLSKDFDPQKMRAGEWAVTIDADTQRQMVYMCFGAGVVKRMGTFDDLESELDPYKEAVQAYKESAERSATNASLSERNAKQSEINAKASELSAEESAEKAMSTTPEGYAQLVDDVGKIPLFSAEGTSLSLETARGGIKVNKVVGKTIKSKNLIDFSKITKGKELGSDGRVVNNSEWYVTDFVFVKPSTTYTLSGTSSVMRVEYDASGNVVADKTANSAIFTTSSKTVKVRFNSKISGYSTPMLNEGGTALPYEPYGLFSSGDMGTITIQERGKNLIPFPYYNNSGYVSNGITFDYDEKGVIKTSGTASSSGAYFRFVNASEEIVSRLKVGKTYRVMGCPMGGATSKYMINLYVSDGTSNIVSIADVGSGISFVMPQNGKTVSIGIRFQANQNGDNLTFKPMLVEVNADGTYPTEYEPYRAKDVIIPLDEPLYEQNVLDVENQQIVKKYASVDLGSLEWGRIQVANGKYRFQASLNNIKTVNNETVANLFSNKLVAKTSTETLNNVEGLSVGTIQTIQVYVEECSQMGSADFANWIKANHITVIYELATPTTEPLTTEQVKALHSLVSYKDKTYIDTTDTYAKATLDVEYGKTDGVALAIQAKNDARLAYEEQKLIPRISVIDNYLSVSQTSALSAARGKDLNTRLLTLEKLLTMSEGQGTKTNNVSSGDCYWWRFGKVVVGQIACTVANVTVYYSNVALFSGLPAPNHSALCGGVEVDGDWTSSAFISIEEDGSLNLHMREETLAKRTIQANFVYILP